MVVLLAAGLSELTVILWLMLFDVFANILFKWPQLSTPIKAYDVLSENRIKIALQTS